MGPQDLDVIEEVATLRQQVEALSLQVREMSDERWRQVGANFNQMIENISELNKRLAVVEGQVASLTTRRPGESAASEPAAERTE